MLRLLSVMLMCFVTAAPTYASNPWTERLCQQTRSDCYQVVTGDAWELLFPDAQQRMIARAYNRQTVELQVGQWVATPPTWNTSKLSPLPLRRSDGFSGIHIDLTRLVGGEYENGQLVMWFPAGGGKDWCADVGRSCRTPTGTFVVQPTFYDGPNRRSSRYPLGCSGNSCAPMPYFMLFDIRRSNGSLIGFGFHGGPLSGYNPSHGCVRAEDAVVGYINQKYRGTALTFEIVQPDLAEVFG